MNNLKYISIFALVSLISCGKSIVQDNIKASTNIPVVAQVEKVHVDYDASLPIWYFTVEPVQIRQMMNESELNVDGTTRNDKGSFSISNVRIHSKMHRQFLADRQPQIVAQLSSALSGVKNFRSIDYEIAKNNNFKLNSLDNINNKGIFIIRAVITEQNDRVSEKVQENNIPLAHRNKSSQYFSIVALDVSVIDPNNNGAILTSFPTKGRYGYESALSRNNFIGKFSSSYEMSNSNIDQALRVALNNSALKLFKKLKKSTDNISFSSVN
jgi:hypothetical protein